MGFLNGCRRAAAVAALAGGLIATSAEAANTVIIDFTLNNGRTGFAIFEFVEPPVDSDPSPTRGLYEDGIASYFIDLNAFGSDPALTFFAPTVASNPATNGYLVSDSVLASDFVTIANGSPILSLDSLATLNGFVFSFDEPDLFFGDSIIEAGTALEVEFTRLNGKNMRLTIDGVEYEGFSTSFDFTPDPAPLQVTEFTYNKYADTLTLTWNSTPDATYSIVYTEDLATGFSNVLNASIASEGASTSYGPVASPVSDADQLFFKVVENE